MYLKKQIINITSKYKTPFLIFDLDIIRKNYRKIKKSIKDVEIFYAVKANDNDRIIKTLISEGSSFEISSEGELSQLKRLNILPEKIICLNPIKSPDFLRSLHRYGTKIISFDSRQEVDKIAKYAPHSQLVLRLQVDNEGSDWPLTNKFGIQVPEAIDLLKYAKKKNLSTIGLTFHVGSQCLNKSNWANALYVCEEIWKEAKEMNLNLSLISLGGGIPIKHTKAIPSIQEIGEVINPILKNNFKELNNEIRVTIEPGRGIVGDAAIMVTSVVGIANRGKENWIYIDVGVFNGLMETIENFAYELKVLKGRKKQLVTIAGPSCDSVDVMFKNTLLPKVDIGDRLYILNAGAYTTVYGSRFNAFDIPKTYFLKN